MTTPSLRRKLLTEPVIGTFTGLESGAAIESLGRVGFDFLCIDAEHGALDIHTIADLLRSSALVGVPTLVRVPEVGPYIGRVLDAGAAGVLVPRIETADQAAEAVARARYTPEGTRGVGPGRGGYGGAVPVAEHMRATNDAVVVAVQIETQRGIDNADAILGTPGVDAVVVGPMDLAASLGTTMGSPEHTAAVDRIIDAAAVQGTASGAFCLGVPDAERVAARGARLLIVGADSLFLATAAAQTWSALESVRTPAEVVR
jgi:2-keto-3-deoxy-L-rhamnonate aldolase RhmA